MLRRMAGLWAQSPALTTTNQLAPSVTSALVRPRQDRELRSSQRYTGVEGQPEF